jgi:hypothetical protein
MITVKKLNGNKLQITCPINKELPLSKKAKSRIVCTTRGGQLIEGVVIDNKHNKHDNNLVLNLTAYVQATDKEAVNRAAELEAIAKAAAKNG